MKMIENVERNLKWGWEVKDFGIMFQLSLLAFQIFMLILGLLSGFGPGASLMWIAVSVFCTLFVGQIQYEKAFPNE